MSSLSPIRYVLAVVPVFKETFTMIQRFRAKMDEVAEDLKRRSGVELEYLFLNDGAKHLPEHFPMLVRHKENLGLDRTLIDGYEAILQRKRLPDLIVRLDSNEHEPHRIADIVEHMSHTDVQACFFPIWYSAEGEVRPPMRCMVRMMAEFADALAPINPERVLAVYNQKFPMGYQAFRPHLLGHLVPLLKKGVEIQEALTSGKARWGMDLLAILVAANLAPEKVDFFFAGWATPWKENRGPEKIAAQEESARLTITVAERLGCRMKRQGIE